MSARLAIARGWGLDDEIYARLIRSHPDTAPRLHKLEGRDCLIKNDYLKVRETVTYEGACKAGVSEGPGTTTWRSTVNGAWLEQTETETSRKGQLNRKGESRSANVDVCIGNFVDDRPDGQGTLTTNGRTIVGLWNDSCFDDKASESAIGRSMESCGV